MDGLNKLQARGRLHPKRRLLSAGAAALGVLGVLAGTFGLRPGDRVEIGGGRGARAKAVVRAGPAARGSERANLAERRRGEGAGGQERPTDPGPAWGGLRKGQELRYRLDMSDAVRVTPEGAAGAETRLSVRADVVLRVYQESEDGFEVGIEIRCAAVQGEVEGRGAEEPAELARGLETELRGSWSRLGEPRSWSFPADQEPMVRNVLRGLVAPLVWARPAGEERAWSRMESDLTGAYRAAYELRDAGKGHLAFRKTKQYVTVRLGMEEVDLGAAGAPELAADGEWWADVDAGLGYPTRVKGRQNTRMTGGPLGSTITLEGRQEYHLELLAQAPAAKTGLVQPDDRQNLRNGESRILSADLAPEPEPAEATGRRVHTGEDLMTVLARLRGVVRGGRLPEEGARLQFDLRTLFAEEAEEIAPALRALRNGSLEPSEAQLLAVALAWSGAPEAVEGIRRLATDGGADSLLREVAAEALGYELRPDATTVRSLAEIAGASEPSLSDAALRSLGRIGARSGSATEEVRSEAGTALLSNPPAAPRDPTDWLRAMGSATPEGGLERLRSFLTHSDDRIRAEAEAAAGS
ncbi:MAG: hypothetical protein HYZ53_20120 [Planctomycetes bacterium]|nr:hypothetical protein [Planctomycetota bacterium]